LRASQQTFNTDEDTIAPWLNYFLSVVKKQATEALQLVTNDTAEDTLSPKQHQVLLYFDVIAEASPLEITEATGIAMPTVRKALDRLVQAGKLKRVGRGRATRYVKL